MHYRESKGKWQGRCDGVDPPAAGCSLSHQLLTRTAFANCSGSGLRAAGGHRAELRQKAFREPDAELSPPAPSSSQLSLGAANHLPGHGDASGLCLQARQVILGLTSCTGNGDSKPQTKDIGIKKGMKNFAPGKMSPADDSGFTGSPPGGHMVSAGGSSSA